MASKEATTAAAASASAAPEKKEKKDVATFAFEFKLAKAKIGAKTTNKQVKSKVNEAFMGYGAFDECRVVGDVDQDRTVYVFFARLFGKGQPVWDSLQKGEPATVKLYDEDVPITLSGEKPSGGGATTGTATLAPKKEAGKKEGKGRGRGEKKAAEGAAPAGAPAAPGAEGKDGEKKDGGRGRGRGPKKEEKKGPSLQRGRANVGGKLGPVSKIRLARIEKEKKEKEKAERKARGENVDEEEEKKEEDPSAHIVKPKEAGKKEEKGKGEAGKKGEKGKAEAGKKEEKGKGEAGKKDAGKKEAGKKGK